MRRCVSNDEFRWRNAQHIEAVDKGHVVVNCARTVSRRGECLGSPVCVNVIRIDEVRWMAHGHEATITANEPEVIKRRMGTSFKSNAVFNIREMCKEVIAGGMGSHRERKENMRRTQGVSEIAKIK